MRRFPKKSSERGAVIVMVAVWLPVLALFVSFAVDFAHFFDYSRNLQNRADASALAAGAALGGCIGSSGSQTAIEHTAQQYAGPPDNQAHLPDTYASSQPYQNVPNLTMGKGRDFFMVLNGATSADKGGTSFSDGHACSADYTSPAGPAIDVWLTQQRLPLFFPLVPFNPNISAHARVQLQAEGSSPTVRPVAVSDPGSFSCATVFFKNSADDSTVATANLTETDPANLVFDSTSPVSLTMPTDLNSASPTARPSISGGRAHVYMQVRLSDCNGNGETFDDSTNTGIEAINGYDTGTPSADQPPRISSVTVNGTNFHGVTLSGSCPAPGDQYFVVPASGGSCNVQPTAVVTFSVGKQDASVTAIDKSTGQSLTLSPNNAGNVWAPNGNGAGNSFVIGDSDGRHPIEITWQQTNGTINGTACGTGKNSQPVPCTGSFGVQAQAFGACNGCDQPDDSGPIVQSQIRLTTDPVGTTGQNSFQQGSTQQLAVRLQLAGIRAQSGASAPLTILRFSGSTNHQTGLVDCGQGNGASVGDPTPGDAYTIYGGCGPNNPFEPPQCTTLGLNCKLPILNPLYVYSRGAGPTDCSPQADQNYTDWPSGNHQDCVQATPGTRRVSIVCGLLQRITGVTPANFSASSSACNSNNSGTCPTNYWPNYNTKLDDTRKIDVVLTAPIDLANVAGSPGGWVPIRRFARFYVTGWDTSLFPNCGSGGAPNNDAFPGHGKKVDNGAIWGHWITDVDPGGTPDPNNPCPINSIGPVICVPALTR